MVGVSPTMTLGVGHPTNSIRLRSEGPLMDFGLHLGTRGAASSPDNLQALAQHADRLGLNYLGFSDHIVIARSIEASAAESLIR